jgi:hypothetical protein
MNSTLLHLAALLILTAPARAQITDPNNLIAPPPPPIQFRGKHLIRTTDLQWLWQYTQPAPIGNESGLLADPHFRPMLDDNLKAPQAFFRNGKLPLARVAELYFGMILGNVTGIDNRYITFYSCVPHNCTSQGLLWIDTQPQHATVVFAATEWTAEGKSVIEPDADYNLWLFSSRALDIEHPPQSLIEAIAHWRPTAPQHIKTALVIDPDGTPHKINPAAFGATPSSTE